MKTIKEYSLEIGGQTMTAEFNDVADQANGSVFLRCRDTVVMATAVMSKDGRRNPGYFNLTVEYMEKHYAAGSILGGRFNKREGKPTDEAVLSSRVIDRTLRPLFAKHIKNAVQVIVQVIAVGEADPGIMAVNAASLALVTSDIPWAGPVGAVHISRVQEGDTTSDFLIDHYVAPTEDNDKQYVFDLTVCGKGGNINMIEAGANEVSEEDIGIAFDMAMEEISKIEAWQLMIAAEIGKPKLDMPAPELPTSVTELFDEHIRPALLGHIFRQHEDVDDVVHDLEDHWQQLVETHLTEHPDAEQIIGAAAYFYHHEVDELLHSEAINNDRRCDGRAMDTVRDIYARAGGMSASLHGSGLFYRGETHVLSVLTLGGPDDRQLIDGMEVREQKRFMHHYNFPPFSVGDTGRVGGFNRRAIGHGALAEKALRPVIPAVEDFPYTIRLVSESLASNGSTSQASICGSTLALLDGGVPITRPVAGLAMGLMLATDGSGTYKILSDIQGPEDHHGDMDFKVAGTRMGVTAIQLDIKVDGVSPAILKEALQQAKQGRLGILDVMEAEIAAPREDLAASAPRILSTKIDPDKIGLVIGKGGDTIQKLQDDTGTAITIEEDGTIFVTGERDGAKQAVERINQITHEWKLGETTTGPVIKVLDEIGAIVQLSPAADGMVHISEIANFRIGKVSDVLSEGMMVPVTIVKIDKDRGRIGLSIKQDNPNFITQAGGTAAAA